MRPALTQHSSYQPHASLRSRAISTGMAVAATALIIFMLIQVGALGPLHREPKPKVITFQLQPPPPHARARAVVKVDRSSHGVAAPHPAPAPRLNMVVISRSDYAASDIAALPSHQPAGGTQSADTGSDSASSEGPNGEPIYDVAWYREPSRAEMAPYMPATGPEAGWAMIACRMIEHYHVEDCREMGESPSGSGLSRALRQASWQFLVRPPRVGGHSILGGWVRIRFEFTAAGGKDTRDN
jgi:hypothetical protein